MLAGAFSVYIDNLTPIDQRRKTPVTLDCSLVEFASPLVPDQLFFILHKKKSANIDKMPSIKLESNDKQTFDVEVEIANMSMTIKTMIEHLGLEDNSDETIPLPNVDGKILGKIIEWATYHKDDPPKQDEDDNKEKRTDDISDWDKKFLDVDQATLFSIILAANYLDIRGLLDASSKTVANMIKGKSVEEIRKHFNIKNDFTPEEEAKIKKENEWCEES